MRTSSVSDLEAVGPPPPTFNRWYDLTRDWSRALPPVCGARAALRKKAEEGRRIVLNKKRTSGTKVAVSAREQCRRLLDSAVLCVGAKDVRSVRWRYLLLLKAPPSR